jgi:vancomycin resistance protein YoaR
VTLAHHARPQPEPESHHARPRRWVRPTLVGIGVAAALLVASYVAAWVMVGSGVPVGTTVAGVPIGGLSAAAAEVRLTDELGPRSAAVDVSVQGDTVTLDADRVGLTFDPAATVDAAGERSANPFRLFRQVFGAAVAPVVTVDDGALDATVRSLARRVDDDPRQGGVRYDGLDVVATTPRTGEVLDRASAGEAIRTAYLVADAPVELPVRTVEPKVTAAEVQRVAGGLALQAISAPILLSVAGEQLEVPPEVIAATLTFVPRAGRLVPRVDGVAVHDALADDFALVETPAVDATFDVSSGRPVVVPSSDGEGVAAADLAQVLTATLALPEGSREADLTIAPLPASLTTREARGLGVKRVVSSYTQYFPYAAYRVTNIGVAGEKIDGTVLEPGEVFSLNDVVGERTPENGFVKGYVIASGNRLVEDYGGAVSTITTATWHTAFYAGMTRLEQRAHGYWISRYTAGLEATVSWGYLDLRFRNDTPYGVYLTTSVTDSSVTVTMWSTKYWDIDAEFGPRTNVVAHGTVYDTDADCVAQDGVDGFDITVTRVWRRDGEVVRREPLTTNYDPAPTVICSARPKPSPKPTDKPTDKPTEKPSPTTSANRVSAAR